MTKWHAENDNLPKSIRRKPPQKPQGLPALGSTGRSSDGIAAWNEAAWRSAQDNLAPCKNCGRTFLPDRLLVHQKSCQPGKPLKPLSKSVNTVPTTADHVATPPERPRTATLDKPTVLNKAHHIDIGENPFPSENRGATPTSLNRNDPGRSDSKTPRADAFRPQSRPRTRPLSKSQSGTQQWKPTGTVKPPPTPGSSLPRKNTMIGFGYGQKRKPQLIVCYICGREFSTASLPIHEPQCLEKWKIENSKLPRDQRRPLPKKPEIFNAPLSGSGSGSYNIDQANLAARAAADANLCPCRNCGRTFNADRIQVHERICMKSGPPKTAPGRRQATPPPEAAGSSGGSPTSPPGAGLGNRPRTGPVATKKRTAKFVFCYICGRQFTDASLPIHEPQCLQKWDMENQRLPKELRKPHPKKPEALKAGTANMSR